MRRAARPAAPARGARGRHGRPPVIPSIAAIPEAAAAAPDRIVQRPDGDHWMAPDGRQEFGPFQTLEQAPADMLDAVDEDAPQPDDALPEVHSEIGIADRIDHEAGAPAERRSPAHLDWE